MSVCDWSYEVMRTYIIPCKLNRDVADSLNLESGRICTQVFVSHWRAFRKKNVWLSQYGAMGLNDYYNPEKALHAYTIDAAQEGFYKAIKTARAVRKIDPSAKFPHRTKRFRTTIWKQTGIKRDGGTLTLSNGRSNEKITIALPDRLADVLRVLEVRLVFDKKSYHYNWHIVAEDGKQPKPAPGTNVVSVDLGEIHPAVVGDEDEAVVITMRQLRSEKQGHAKWLASYAKSLSRKKKGSRRYKSLQLLNRLLLSFFSCRAKQSCVRLRVLPE